MKRLSFQRIPAVTVHGTTLAFGLSINKFATWDSHTNRATTHFRDVTLDFMFWSLTWRLYGQP